MELKTQALDRVLEALSPALAVELDRLATEIRQTLEQDFQKRLQTAVRETEATVRTAIEPQLQRAINDAKEATRKQVAEELEKNFRRTFEETTAQIKSEASDERTRLQEQVDRWRIFAECQVQFAEASSQAEILARFMKLAEPFCVALAVYVSKPDGLALWKSRGKAAFPEIISQETTDPESYFRRVSVRGKTVAAVCGAPPFKEDALDFMVASMERAIEVFGLRLRAQGSKAGIAAEALSVVPAAQGAPSPGKAPAAEDARLHAEARRTARLLVSEIKLYHEEELKNGRENHDIYDRLQKEIDSGRELYKQRVPSAVLAGHDYFHEEVVRILGEGDASRLGPSYPTP